MQKRLKNKKQKEFLKIFGDKEFYYSVRESCGKANLGKSSFYRWLEEDARFRKEVDIIKRNREKDPFKEFKKGNITASIKLLKKSGRWG